MEKDELISTYAPKISRLTKRMISQSDISQEAEQEVWHEILKSLDSFRGESSISTWIYTIAKRTILRYIKTEQLVTHEDLDQCIAKGQIPYEGEEQDKEEWIRKKCETCTTGFLQCLNKESRLVFLFRENLELPYSEIALVMDQSEQTIRKTASRSLKKVRRFMGNDCLLINPHGRCGCRIKETIQSIKFQDFYKDIHKANNLIEFFKEQDKHLPKQDFWYKNLDLLVTK